RIETKRDDRVSEEVDPVSCRAFPDGRGVSGIDVQQAQLGIDGWLRPRPAAGALAALPRVLRDLPTIVSGILRNGVEDPLDRAGHTVECHNQPARYVAIGDAQPGVQRPVQVGRGSRHPIADGILARSLELDGFVSYEKPTFASE